MLNLLRSFARHGAMFLPVLLSGLAAAQLPDPVERTAPLRVYWNVITDASILQRGGQGTDWAAMVNLDGLPLRRDIVVLYEHRLGNFPKAGPQEIAQDPNYMDAHLAKVRRDIAQQIPDPEFSGVAVIDYETWNLQWDLMVGPVVQAWTRHVQSMNPSPIARLGGDARNAVLRETYDRAAKDFVLATIRECKALRPNAQWGMYDYPGSYGGTAALYNDPTWQKLKDRNDQLSWLWEALDVITPSLYSWRKTVPDGAARNPRTQYTTAEHRAFLRALITESKRVADGKPVYGYVWGCYLPNAGADAGKECNSTTMEVLFDEVEHSNIDGMIIWEDIGGRNQYLTFNRFTANQLSLIHI